MTRVYENVFLRNKTLAFRRFEVKKPRHSENSLTEICCLHHIMRSDYVGPATTRLFASVIVGCCTVGAVQ